MQSAYRKHHSTKTALLRVMNNVLRTVDCRRDVVLVMLDLSAASDSLEHTILLGRLSRYFGFSHTALRWCSSYLTGRIQSITRDLKHRRRNGTTTRPEMKFSRANLLGMRKVVKTSSSLRRRRNSGRFAVVAKT